MIKARSIPMPVRRRKADFQRPLKIVTVRYRKGICRQDMITQPGHTWTQRHCTPTQPPSRKVSKPSDNTVPCQFHVACLFQKNSVQMASAAKLLRTFSQFL